MRAGPSSQQRQNRDTTPRKRRWGRGALRRSRPFCCRGCYRVVRRTPATSLRRRCRRCRGRGPCCGTSRSGRAVCCTVNTGVPERRERRREIGGEGARVCVARTVAASLRTPSRCTPDRGSRPRRRRRCTPPARLERAGANSGGDRRRRPPHLHAVTPITRTSDKIPVNPM